MSVERVATLFGVHRRTVEKWFASGLERVRLGGKVYTTRNALQRFAKYQGPDSAAIEEARQRNERDARELAVRFGN